MEDRPLFALIWHLAMREHQMLQEVLPVAEEMGNCLRRDLKPSPEELEQWLAIEHRVHRSFGETTEAIAGIQQMVHNAERHS